MKNLFVILFCLISVVTTAQRVSLKKGIQPCFEIDGITPKKNCFVTTDSNGEQMYVDSAWIDSLFNISGGSIVPECLDSLHQDFDGDDIATEFEVTNFQLINPAGYTADQIESFYLVDLNGLIMRYDDTPDNIGEYRIDFAAQEIETDPDFPPLTGDNISITRFPFKFYEVFLGDDVSFEFNVTNCGIVDDNLFDAQLIETNYLIDRNGLILRYSTAPDGIDEFTFDFANQEVEIDSDFPLLTGETLGVRN